MKKVTINLPEKMIDEIMILADVMREEEFWSQAVTWRHILKKGMAYYKKDLRFQKELNKRSKRQDKNTTEDEEEANEPTFYDKKDRAKYQIMRMIKAQKEQED